MNDRLDFNQQVIEEFRANDGKVGGPFEGSDMILITTTGRRTGRQLTSPLVCTTDGDGNHVVIASMAGGPKHPSWYHNLTEHPNVTVEVPGESYAARAEITEGDDRQALYDAQTERYPVFAEYAEKAGAAGRTIPVIRLHRV